MSCAKISNDFRGAEGGVGYEHICEANSRQSRLDKRFEGLIYFYNYPKY